VKTGELLVRSCKVCGAQVANCGGTSCSMELWLKWRSRCQSPRNSSLCCRHYRLGRVTMTKRVLQPRNLHMGYQGMYQCQGMWNSSAETVHKNTGPLRIASNRLWIHELEEQNGRSADHLATVNTGSNTSSNPFKNI
jgi:hypothetical protein